MSHRVPPARSIRSIRSIRSARLPLLALAACCVVAAACRSHGAGEATYRAGPPADPVAARAAFWSAIERLDVDDARGAAPDAEHGAFADALRLTLEGRMHEAETGLREAARASADSVLREVARTTLVSVLTYQGDWDALHEMAGTVPTDGDGARDRAGVLAWSAVMRHAPAPGIPELTRPVYVPMRASATGTPMVTVRLNGCTRQFWLDTGSSTTLVAADVAAACGVEPLASDTLEMVTVTGRVAARPAVVDSLSIGGLRARDVHAAIVSQGELQLDRLTSSGRGSPVRIDGVIGFDFLRRLDVELDFGGHQVVFRRAGGLARRGGDRNLHWLGSPVVMIQDARGAPLFFSLDTGAEQSFATPYLLEKMPKVYRGRERRRITGFGGDTTETVPVISYLQLRSGTRTLYFLGLVVREQRRLIFLSVDGVLGVDAGTDGRFRFDMTSGKFLIEG